MGQALRSLVFRPPSPATYLSNNQFRWLPTRGGSVIPAVYFQRNSPFVVLYSHGNAEDLGLVIPYARRCADSWGVSFFCYEYTGYGLSSRESPSEEHLLSDVEAAYHHLVDTLRYSPSNIVLFGKSLGSIPATHLASRQCDVAALVLQSGKYPGDMGCNIDKIGLVKCPVLIVHGSDDTLCTPSHAKALASKHAGITVTCLIEGAGHNDLDCPPFSAHVDAAVLAFLRRISKLAEARVPCTLPFSAVAEAAAFTQSIKRTRVAYQARYINGIPQSFFLSPFVRQIVPHIPPTTCDLAASDYLVARSGAVGSALC